MCVSVSINKRLFEKNKKLLSSACVMPKGQNAVSVCMNEVPVEGMEGADRGSEVEE